MNKKISWGIVIIVVSLFYIFRDRIPDSVWRYIFNYQVLIMCIGLYLVLQKRKIGWGVFGIGIYMYLTAFFEEYFNIGFPVAALLGGIGLIALGIHEKNKTALKERRKENAVYRSSTKDSSAKTEPETAVEVAAETIEDAQEVK